MREYKVKWEKTRTLSVPKTAVYQRISHRKFLDLGGGAVSALGVDGMTLGLGFIITRSKSQASSSDDARWKKNARSRLVFMSENSPPSFAIWILIGFGVFSVFCILFARNDNLLAANIGVVGATTLPAMTRELVPLQTIQWGQIMAAGVVTTLPMMFLGLVIRKYLVTGLTMGAARE